MTRRSLALAMILMLALLLGFTLSACQTECQPETIEVTRIHERRVIEKVVVTVEVTRIQRVVATARPTSSDVIPPQADETSEPASGTPSITATPATATPSPTETAAPVLPGVTSTAPTSSARVEQLAEDMLTALKGTEQTLLSVQQALNSNPVPVDDTIDKYDMLRDAPTFSVPEGEVELQSFYIRYREQVDRAIGQATDLLTHLREIQAGEAVQTEIRPTQLAMARDAASASTSTVQGLIRELENFLAAQP